jgi:hypothetical protein
VLVDVNQTNHPTIAARAVNISAYFIELIASCRVTDIQTLRPLNGFEHFCLKGIKPQSFAVEAAVYFNSGTDDLLYASSAFRAVCETHKFLAFLAGSLTPYLYSNWREMDRRETVGTEVSN